MRQVRRNVFETNSSSSHSLVVTKGDNYYTSEEIRQEVGWRLRPHGGYIKLSEDEAYFGRSPFRILYSFFDKALYAYACAYKDEYKQNLINIIQEITPEFRGFTFYNEEESYVGTDDCLLFTWLKKAGITLKEYLMNKKYKVVCDGDEYCIWYDMKENGLINMDNIEEEIL